METLKEQLLDLLYECNVKCDETLEELAEDIENILKKN